MAPFSATIKYAWKTPVWMSLSATWLGSKKKRRKDNGGHLTKYWCWVHLPLSMKKTLHCSERVLSVGTIQLFQAQWEMLNRRAEPPRVLPQEQHKQNLFILSMRLKFPSPDCPKQALNKLWWTFIEFKGPDLTELPSYLFSGMFGRNTWNKLAPVASSCTVEQN